MKIGAQLQLAMANMDKQVELARQIGGEMQVSDKEARAIAKTAKDENSDLGNNVDVEA